MGSQPLGAKWLRRIARATGLDIVRAWGHGGYTHGFVDRLHRHGSINASSLEWQLCTYEEQKGWPHYSTCCQFPDDGGYGSPWSEEVLAQCGLEPIVWSPRDEMERLRWRLARPAPRYLRDGPGADPAVAAQQVAAELTTQMHASGALPEEYELVYDTTPLLGPAADGTSGG